MHKLEGMSRREKNVAPLWIRPGKLEVAKLVPMSAV